MKKHFILSIVLMSGLYGVEISKSKTFEYLLEASNKSTSFSVSLENTSSNFIENRFNDIAQIVKDSSICTGGKYNIYPYNKTQDRKVMKLYRSNINFQCNFIENKKYENLLSKIKQQDVMISQNKINYTLSKSQLQKANETLEQKAFDYSKNYTQKLNTHFKNCKVKTINFSKNHSPIRAFQTMSSNKILSTTITEPLDHSVTTKLSVNYTFQCKI